MVRRALLLGAGLAALASAAQAQTFDATFKPVRQGDEVTGIEVVSTLKDVSDAAPFSLSAPVVYAGVPGIADRVQDLKVIDAAGEVPLVSSDDPAAPGGFPYFRHWNAQRDVSYPVTISYRSVVQPVGSRQGPPFGIRPSGGGVSGAGSGFLVIPSHIKSGVSRIKWDLSDMPAGSTGIASFGEGAVEVKGPPSRLMQSWYIAGPVGRYPAEGQDHGFSAAWLGASPFDPAVDAAWSAKLYTFIAEDLKYLQPPPPYRVFMRFLDTPPVGGGTALPNSFMLSQASAPRDPKAIGPRRTLAHEMMHQWTGGIEAPQGISSWFSEGLNTYLTAVLPKRGGFTTIADYAEEVAEISEGYYGVAARTWTAERIAKAGFGDEKIRHVPYNRGALYFADIDARIRAKSGGKRRLEDALQPLFVAREAGQRFDHAAWKAFVVRELGEGVDKEFEDRILNGVLFKPHSNAFGPCFQLAPKTYVQGGDTLEGYTFVRKPGVSDRACKAW
ncbi:hypothetical protein ABOZ73_18230 [Caulobacter sp. 73W]|uniref:Peptidase M61 catalytic domain-containing protein n=1 Tax=Caulobacter sp. 73W TaxID=3161137 RepID=A0AB39KSI2_9CAUL